jgi:TP901 family phage tail tape measure protein
MAKNVTSTMGTTIALNVVETSKSIKSLTNLVSLNQAAWKRQTASLFEAGETVKAYQAKVSGLSESMSRQQAKIDALKEKQSQLNISTAETAEKYIKLMNQIKELKTQQDQLDTSVDKNKQTFNELQVKIESLTAQQKSLKVANIETANSYLKYQTQIERAEAKLSGFTSQQKKAESRLELEKTGIIKLKDATDLASRSSESYVKVLEAQGNEWQAQKAKLNGLKDVHTKMSAQLAAEQNRLTSLSEKYGNSSKEYQEQKIRVNNLTSAYASNSREIVTLNSKVGNLSNTTLKVRDVSKQATTAIKKGWQNVKTGTAVAATGIAAVSAAMFSGAKKASTLQNEYKVTTNLLTTGGEKASQAVKNVAQMQKDGIKYSVQYGKSQKDIAEQYQELVKRGYSSKEALGAMKSELQASVASGDDFNDVVKVSSQVVDAFGMRTDNTAKMTANSKRAVNELAYAADMTATDFQSLGKGMEYVGDSAHSAGFKLSETSAAMGELSNHGLEADKAGTGLRKVVNSISDALAAQEVAQKGVSGAISDYNEQIAKHQRKINELNADVKNGTKTQKAATSAIQTQKDAISDLSQKIQDAKSSSGGTSLLDKLGIKRSDLVDAKGNFKSLSTIMSVINDKTKNLGKAKKASVFNSLFGTTGQQAGIILAQHNKELSELTDKVQKAGDKGEYVAVLAKKNSNTAQQSEKRFEQAWSNLTIMFGSKLLPYMTQAADDLSKTFAKKDFQDAIKKDAKYVGKFANGVLQAGEWAAKHTDDIKTFAKIVATIWVVDKVKNFAREVQDFFDLMGAGKTKLEQETTQVNILSDAYQNLADKKTAAASVGTGTTVSTSSTGKTVSTAENVGSTVVSDAESTVAKSGSKWNLLGTNLASRLINGAGLALTAWDVGSSISKAVKSNSASAKYTAAGKTAGTLIGGGIGAVIAGPTGAMIGATLGDQIGGSSVVKKAVKTFVKNWNANVGKVTIKTPKISAKTAYSELLKAQKSYISQKEKNDLAAIKELHKTGNMSDAEYTKQVAAIKAAAKNSKTIENSSGKDRTVVAKYYASQRQKIEESYNKKKSSILNKYNREIRYSEETSGKNSLATKKLIAEKKAAIDSASSKKSKQLSDLNVKYAKNDMTEQAKLHETLTGKIQLESNKQQKILQNLTKNKGKLSQQQLRTAVNDASSEYKQTVKLANQEYSGKMKAADKTYNAVIKAATRQENESISAANSQYKKTVAAANSQYKGNSQWAEQQRAAVKKKAEDQRTSAVNAAFDQYNKTKQHAENQYSATKSAAEKQRSDVTTKAEKQKEDVVSSASNQSKGVLGHAVKQTNGSLEAQSKQGSGTMSIWSRIASWWNSLAKDFGVETIKSSKGDFSYSAMSMPAYANGSGTLKHDQLALVGEAGAELAYKPYSGQVRLLGKNGAQFTQLQAGEMILNARDTRKVLSGSYAGKLPAYSKGTTTISNFVSEIKSGASSLWDNVSDSAMDLIDNIKDPVKLLTNIANSAFNLKSVANVGTVAQEFSQGLVKKGIEAIANVVKKLSDSGSASNPSGSGVKRWESYIKKAAATMKISGITDGQINKILKVIQNESGGDPTVIQKVKDINSEEGHPAQGLLQFVPSTFRSYMVSGHTNIKNGYDQLLAMFNDSNWASDVKTGGWGPSGHRRFADGGISTIHQLAEISEENQPELVLPLSSSKKNRADQLLESVGYNVSRNSANNSGNDTSQDNLDKLLNKMDKICDAIGSMASKTTQINVNGKAFAKAVGSDTDNMMYQRQQNVGRYGHA